MTVRRRRKKNKLRGQRTHGKGDSKNKRGAGCRGGRGRAGSHKHKFSKYYGEFGKERKRLKKKGTVRAINLDALEAMLPKLVADKRAEKSDVGIVLDGRAIGFDKVLGMGNIKEKVVLRHLKASKKAAEKIAASGGSIESEQGAEEK